MSAVIQMDPRRRRALAHHDTNLTPSAGRDSAGWNNEWAQILELLCEIARKVPSPKPAATFTSIARADEDEKKARCIEQCARLVRLRESSPELADFIDCLVQDMLDQIEGGSQ
jgi:hypothetical protein